MNLTFVLVPFMLLVALVPFGAFAATGVAVLALIALWLGEVVGNWLTSL